jgi:hypothetical protein
MTFFPWLIVLLLMALIAELAIVGPRALRSIIRGEGIHVTPASARAVLLLVLLQLALVIGWLLFFRPRL